MKKSRSAYIREVMEKHPDWTNQTIADYCVRHGQDVNAGLVSSVRQYQKKHGKTAGRELPSETSDLTMPQLIAVTKIAKTVGGVRKLKPIVDLLCSLQE